MTCEQTKHSWQIQTNQQKYEMLYETIRIRRRYPMFWWFEQVAKCQLHQVFADDDTYVSAISFEHGTQDSSKEYEKNAIRMTKHTKCCMKQVYVKILKVIELHKNQIKMVWKYKTQNKLIRNRQMLNSLLNADTTRLLLTFWWSDEVACSQSASYSKRLLT